MKLSHDLLLALAYVSRISDPDLLRSRFFESLNARDDGPAFTFTAQSPAGVPENRIFPIATLYSSFGYAVIDEIPELDDDDRAVFRNVFQFLAVLLENREQAETLKIRNEAFRKQVEESLASNDTLLRIAGETAKFGGWSVDLRNNICTWSDKVADIHDMPKGYSPPVEDGINFYAPEWREKITQVFMDCAEKGIPYDEEMVIISAKGRRVWVRTTGEAVRNESGKIIKVQGAFQDITDRKNAETSLAHSYDLMQYIIEHSNGAVAVHDRELKYVYVSQRYIDDYKLHGQEIIGKHHYEVFPDLPQKWRVVHQKALKGEISSADRDPFYRADGTVEWTRWECRPWYDADDAIGGFIICTEVITDHVKAEEALRDSETRFRLLAESAPVGIVISDTDQRTIYVSKRFVELFGYTMEDMPSVEAWWPLAYPDETQREKIKNQWNEALEEAQKSGTDIAPMEFPVTCKDGAVRHIEFRMAFAGDFNFVIFIDVTERKMMEIELKQANTILSQLLKVANQLTLARTKDDVVQIIKTATRRLIGADGVAVVLRENDMCHYIDEEAVSPLWKGKRFQMDDCISGWVMQHRKSVAIEDISVDPRIPYESYRPTFVKSLALSPIRSKNPIGAIGAYWGERHKATDSELSLLAALCDMTDSAWDAMEKEKSLRKSDEFQRAIVESSPLAVFSLDLNGNVLTWNTSAEKIFGWQADEIRGAPLPIVPKDKIPEFEHLLNRVKTEGGFTGLELVRQKKNNELIDISLSTAPIHDDENNVIGIVATVEDITERKKADEQLHRLKDHLEQEVAIKTRELKDRVSELERFHDATIEREFRIKELRDEIEKLKRGESRGD